LLLENFFIDKLKLSDLGDLETLENLFFDKIFGFVQNFKFDISRSR